VVVVAVKMCIVTHLAVIPYSFASGYHNGTTQKTTIDNNSKTNAPIEDKYFPKVWLGTVE
jgi:hypothetical protein